MTIAACPRCGSTRIEMGTLGTGVTFGVTSWKSVCRNCGYQGEPLLFDTEKGYNEFFQKLTKNVSPKETTESGKTEIVETDVDTEVCDLSEKDKEVLDFLHDVEQEVVQQDESTSKNEIFPKDKSWWPEIVLAMICSTVFLLFSAPRLFELFDFFFGFVYCFTFFVVQTLGILLGLVILEFFYKSIKNRKK